MIVYLVIHTLNIDTHRTRNSKAEEELKGRTSKFQKFVKQEALKPQIHQLSKYI